MWANGNYAALPIAETSSLQWQGCYRMPATRRGFRRGPQAHAGKSRRPCENDVPATQGSNATIFLVCGIFRDYGSDFSCCIFLDLLRCASAQLW